MSQLPLDQYAPLHNGGYLIIPETLLAQLRRYRQRSQVDTEAGGVLIGTWRVSGNTHKKVVKHAEITDVTVPEAGDSRSRYGFIRRSIHHLERIKRAWTESKQKQTYLGEWHTHPEIHPSPSPIDLLEWRKNLKTAPAIVIIVGIESEWIGYWDGERAYNCGCFVPDL